MVIVTVNSKQIKITGHSNFENKGKDIVCAAISSLVTATVNSLQGFKDKEFKINDGEVVIAINHKVSHNDQIRLDMMITGLKLIAKKYPSYIKIKESKL